MTMQTGIKHKTNVFGHQDKHIGDLSPAERDEAQEDWLRSNSSYYLGQARQHIEFLLRRLDQVRDSNWEAK